jgi:hypothetical protein
MKKMILLGFVLIGVALAADTSLKLTVNGKPSSTPAVVVNGKTYLPLDALEKAGLKVVRSNGALAVTLPGANASPSSGTTSVGGANQRASLEGCLGEQLFNGVWRIRASKLERITKDGGTPGWGLTLELRNGSKATLISTDAGIDGTGQGIQLAFDDATTLEVDPYDVQKLTYASLPQGGAVVHQLKFYYPAGTASDAVKTPVKFLLEVNAKGIGFTPSQQGVAFTVANPSLRVRLDCQR